MIKLTISLLFSTLLLSTVLLAGNGGSTYSRYGIGDIRYATTSAAIGIGGANIGVMTSSSLEPLNPATWSQITLTRFSVSALYEGFSSQDDVGTTKHATTNFHGLSLALPASISSGIVFGAGITPFSSVNYNITTPVSQAGLDYTLRYDGEGGISQAYVGLSANLGPELHVGGKLNYYFGTLRHSVVQTFTSTSLYSNAEVLRSFDMKGVGLTFGLVHSGLNKMLRVDETSMISLGLVISTSTTLSANEEHQFKYSVGNLVTRDTSSFDESTYELPYALGAGLSFMSERVLIASDLYYQRWSRTKGSGVNISPLRDSYRFSIGGEILPKRESSAPFTQRLAYRLGFFYDQTYYRIKGEPINEIGFSGGIGFPIFLDTRLNIAAEYSFRGTTNQQLQKDNILRLSFTLSGAELWFIRPEQE